MPTNEPGQIPAIYAPWTPEQVEQLNRFQRLGIMHPFTCGNPMHNVSVELVATTEGWVCPNAPCEYTQNWAHAGMANQDFMDRQEHFIENLRKKASAPRAGHESYRGFRISSLWAYTQVDPEDDQEGIIAFRGVGGTMMPMIASDRVAVDSWRPIAEATAKATGRPVKLSRFSVREDLEAIEAKS